MVGDFSVTCHRTTLFHSALSADLNVACTSVIIRLSPLWNDDPENYVGQDARQAAWNQQEQEKQAEPARIDAEKGPQAATDAGDDGALPS